MINYLIIDDEHIAHDIIKGYCDMLPAMKLAKHCYDAIEALEYLNKHEVDLIFLDLNMPKLKGFEFLKTLTNPPKVIVTTAYSEFALEGYELNVIDYLLKPFGFERFLKAVNKVVGQTGVNKQTPTQPKIAVPRQIFLKENNSYIQVNIDSIIYMEASGNYTKVVTSEQPITIRGKISDMIEVLPQQEFLQVHKSFAVATAHISSIEGNRITLGTHHVPIGKTYKMNVNNLLK